MRSSVSRCTSRRWGLKAYKIRGRKQSRTLPKDLKTLNGYVKVFALSHLLSFIAGNPSNVTLSGRSSLRSMVTDTTVCVPFPGIAFRTWVQLHRESVEMEYMARLDPWMDREVFNKLSRAKSSTVLALRSGNASEVSPTRVICESILLSPEVMSSRQGWGQGPCELQERHHRPTPANAQECGQLEPRAGSRARYRQGHGRVRDSKRPRQFE